MKKFLSSLVLLTVLAVMPAKAQFSFGVKGGLNLSSMSFNKDGMEDAVKNNAGWFVGPSVKFSLPVLPLTFDASALYDQKKSEIEGEDIKQQSILVPINVRYNIGLSSLASVYVAAGPQFGFNVGDTDFSWNISDMTTQATNKFQLKKSTLSLNLGAGVTVIKHLEVGFAYNLALGNTADASAIGIAGDVLSDAASNALGAITGKSKNNTWTVSAAFYF